MYSLRCLAKFRRFKSSTSHSQYRHGVIKLISIVIRCMLWRKYAIGKALGKFKPKLTSVQHGFFKTLYSYLESGSHTTLEDIAPVIHSILYHIYATPTDPKVQVATLVDQTLILSILTTSKERWLPPEVLCHLCAHLQRTGFCVSFHTAWHGGIEVDYVSNEGHQLRDKEGEDEDENENEDEGEDDEDEEYDGMGINSNIVEGESMEVLEGMISGKFGHFGNHASIATTANDVVDLIQTMGDEESVVEIVPEITDRTESLLRYVYLSNL